MLAPFAPGLSQVISVVPRHGGARVGTTVDYLFHGKPCHISLMWGCCKDNSLWFEFETRVLRLFYRVESRSMSYTMLSKRTHD